MDGDPVREGEPENAHDGSDDGNADVAPIRLAEMLTNLCPAYMAMGMGYEEYWNCNTKVHKAYRLAWEQKKKYRNWEMWWQGGYIYDALLKVAPVMRAALGKGKVEAGKYAEEPYPLTKKEAEEIQERKRVENMKRMLAVLEMESAKNANAMEPEAKED